MTRNLRGLLIKSAVTAIVFLSPACFQIARVKPAQMEIPVIRRQK